MRDSDNQKDSEIQMAQWVADAAPILSQDELQSALGELKTRLGKRPGSDPASDSSELPSFSIPNFEIMGLLGRGGMGTVWQARQLAPISRVVAIKLLQPGLEHHRSRFQQERQALAMLNHPNIARIYDAGETGEGQPYFVMEYISGENFIDYCRNRRLDLNAKLNLFLKVIRAIDYSHNRGLIHRDLKPSNILVSDDSSDGSTATADKMRLHEPVVKVIDYGLVRYEIDSEWSGNLEKTAENMVLGSPFWMSPEQASAAGASGIEVDRRSDVYSLGAVLYQLVTSSPPVTPDLYTSHSVFKILQSIQCQDVESPSRRLNGLRQGRYPCFSGNDPVPAESPPRDLEAIISKTLEREPVDRYASAHELAEDIQRYLDGRPVMAQRPTPLSHAMKWTRRHRKKVLGAAISSAVVFVAIGLAVVATGDARRQQNAAKNANDKAAWKAAEAQRATDAADLATTQSQRFEQELTFIDELFKNSLDRIMPFGKGYTAAKKDTEYLDQLSERILVENLSDRNRLELAYKIGVIWLGYDDSDRAHQVILKGLEMTALDQGPERFKADCLEARCRIKKGEMAEGIERLRSRLSQYEAELEYDVSKLLEERSNLAAAYVSAGRNRLALKEAQHGLEELKQSGKQSEKTYLNLLSVTGLAYDRMGMTIQGIEAMNLAFQAEVKEVPKDLIEIVFGTNLVYMYKNIGQYEKAYNLADQILVLAQERFGHDHSRTLDLRKARIVVSYFTHEGQSAISELEQLLLEVQQQFGPEHRLALNINHDLASLLIREQRFSDAINLIDQSFESRIEVYGNHHGEVIKNRNLLGMALSGSGREDEAFQVYKSTLDEGLAATDFVGAALLGTLNQYVILCLTCDQEDKAFLACQEFLDRCREDSVVNHSSSILACERLRARLAFQIGDYERAEKWLKRIYQKPGLNESNADPLVCINLAEIELSRRQYVAAEPYLASVLAQSSGQEHLDYHRILAQVLLAEVLLEKGQVQKAFALVVGAIRSKQLVLHYENYAHGLLGSCYLRTGELSEAEKHLLSAHENLVQLSSQAKFHAWYMPRISKNLYQLYRLQGNQIKAVHWRNVAEQNEMKFGTRTKRTRSEVDGSN